MSQTTEEESAPLIVYEEDEDDTAGDEENHGDGWPPDTEPPPYAAEEDPTVTEPQDAEGGILKPKTGLRFEKLSELMEFYAYYAMSVGFQTKIRTVDCKDGYKTPPGEDKRIRYDQHAHRARLECNKCGQFRSEKKNPNTITTSCKTGCKAGINVWKNSKDNMWRIFECKLDHNHPLEPKDSRHMVSYREISTRDKGKLVANHRAGISMNKNFMSLMMEKKGFANTPFTEKDARNLINHERRLQITQGDVVAMRAWLREQQKRCKDFLFVLDTNDAGVLRNVFWVDGRSRAAFRDFGDVVSFDTTYLKNRYKMPFAPFIGVNHHGQSTLFGCALISGEDTENFVWLFEQWKLAMGGKEPRGIITDQCAAMAKAIAIVFPNTEHRLCIFHIMLNAERHLQHLDQWTEVQTRMKELNNNPLTVKEFEDGWMKMLTEFDVAHINWLSDVFEIRHKWAPVFFRANFWAGMSSTQRSEGINFFFKCFVNLDSTLTVFVEQFSLALAKRANDESKATFASKNSPIQVATEYCYEALAQRMYTNEKFKEFQAEVLGVLNCHEDEKVDLGETVCYTISDMSEKCLWRDPAGIKLQVAFNRQTMDIRCECKMMEFRGILCRHILDVLHNERVQCIPSQYILDRWRKDVPRNYLNFPVPYFNVDMQPPEPQTYVRMREKFDEVARFLVGEEHLVTKYLQAMDDLKAEAAASLADNSAIRIEEIPGVGMVYRKRRIRPADDFEPQACNASEEDNSSCPEAPPDLRKRGRVATRRTGYHNQTRGRKPNPVGRPRKNQNPPTKPNPPKKPNAPKKPKAQKKPNPQKKANPVGRPRKKQRGGCNQTNNPTLRVVH